MATRKLNRLATQVAKLTNPLPAAYKPWGYTFAFDMMVGRACLSRRHLLFLHISFSRHYLMPLALNLTN
jgi:hypothetical protein